LQTQTKLAQQMDEFVLARDFSGVVLVARNGQVLFQKAYGSANREHGVANKLDTKFRLGSVTKQFTAMAIMILTERGKLSVTDPICKYIDNCPIQSVDKASPSAIRHDLSLQPPKQPDFGIMAWFWSGQDASKTLVQISPGRIVQK
jgi:CubicO group peptidase (beta-lactamase class C family)